MQSSPFIVHGPIYKCQDIICQNSHNINKWLNNKPECITQSLALWKGQSKVEAVASCISFIHTARLPCFGLSQEWGQLVGHKCFQLLLELNQLGVQMCASVPFLVGSKNPVGFLPNALKVLTHFSRLLYHTRSSKLTGSRLSPTSSQTGSEHLTRAGLAWRVTDAPTANRFAAVNGRRNLLFYCPWLTRH